MNQRNTGNQNYLGSRIVVVQLVLQRFCILLLGHQQAEQETLRLGGEHRAAGPRSCQESKLRVLVAIRLYLTCVLGDNAL